LDLARQVMNLSSKENSNDLRFLQEISINELFSGKVLDKDDIVKETDLNLFNTILDSKKKIDGHRRWLVILFSLLFGIIMLFGSFFVIDLFRMREQREVFFSTWGFPYAPSIDLSNEKIEVAIRDYVLSSASKEGLPFEKSFVSTKTYLIEEKENKIFTYLWVVQENWFLKMAKVFVVVVIRFHISLY